MERKVVVRARVRGMATEVEFVRRAAEQSAGLVPIPKLKEFFIAATLCAIATMVASCSCPDREFREYTAHVYLKNNLNVPASLNFRVAYRQKDQAIEYRYSSGKLPAAEEKIFEVSTGDYAVWHEGGSTDCQPNTGEDRSEFGHDAEFSVDSLSNFSICMRPRLPLPYRGGIYEIYESNTVCPAETFVVASGWS